MSARTRAAGARDSVLTARPRRLTRLLAAVVTVVVASAATSAPPVRYALVSVNGMGLPYTPDSGTEPPVIRVLGDTVEVGDGVLRHVRVTRLVMFESLPCDVLREMRDAEAGGGSGGVTMQSFTTTGAPRDTRCDPLRADVDTQEVRMSADRRTARYGSAREPIVARLAWSGDSLTVAFGEPRDVFVYRRLRP